MSTTRLPYNGPSRRLVLAFDIGTTFSGVCYAFLDPGVVPEIQHVTTFLNGGRGDFKIPSTLYYHSDGKFCGAGDPEQWDDVERLNCVGWWKLNLAKGELSEDAKKHITPLPKGKSIVDLFADFILYLFNSTVAHIKEVEPTGEVLWDNFGPTVEFVLTHPNGWEGAQQELMRKAVVQAGIFNKEEALSRVSFVTEGEASFNYCVTNTKSGELLKAGHKVLVIDAGGGTIDISSYVVRAKSPLKVEEIYIPISKLKGSKFKAESDLQAFTECFDKGLKNNFSEDNKPQFVKFGSLRDNDSRCDVKGGKLILQGAQVAKFFKPSLDAIIAAIKNIAGDLDPNNTFIFFVGGFAASPWLFREVGRELSTFGLKLSRPDTQTNKAVAFGAVSHYVNHFVTGRLVKYTYGAIACAGFDQLDPEHRRRSEKKRLTMTGEFILEVFTPILLKGTKVSDTEEFCDKFLNMSPFPPGVKPMKQAVIRYKGKLEQPQWIDLEPDNYEPACHVVVDGTKIPCFSFISPLGLPCFAQAYELVYIYGQTEFKAQFRWTEGEQDEEKRSDAVILYDEVN